jgi:hypothetical protein
LIAGFVILEECSLATPHHRTTNDETSTRYHPDVASFAMTRQTQAFADSLRRKRPDQCAGGDGTRQTPKPRTPDPAAPPRRITGKVRAARARREAP